MITFENVDVVYPNGFKGLSGVDLQINKGEFVGIVGLSGAGKSTLIRAVNGLVPHTAGTLRVGEITVDPKNKSKLRRLRSDVGMIFQSFNLVTRISVLNNVLTGRSAYTPTWRSLLGWYRDGLDVAVYNGLPELRGSGGSRITAAQLQHLAD